MNAAFCPACGRAAETGARFCAGCGSALPAGGPTPATGDAPAPAAPTGTSGAARVERMVQAPTQAEAEAMMAPVVAAFRQAGWTLETRLWVPGDRRIGVGESLVLSSDHEGLLEAEGTLRHTWTHPRADERPPLVSPAVRKVDAFERVGGVRYRRLVPRWGMGLVGFLLFLFIVLYFFLPRWNLINGTMGGISLRGVPVPGADPGWFETGIPGVGPMEWCSVEGGECRPVGP